MIIAKGTVTFTAGGAETAAFSWVDAVLGTPVTFSVTPAVWGPFQTVTTGGQGAGAPYLNGSSAITTSGGTVTMANPPDCTVVLIGIGS
jgi:hypothetical protein